MNQVPAKQGDPKIAFIGAPNGAAGGGMGRVVDYILQSTGDCPRGLRTVPLITRDDQTGKFSSMLRLAKAALTMLRNRRNTALLHVNMGDRGSAMRKGILVILGRAMGFPVFLHLHAVEMELLPKWALRLLGVAFRSATCVIVLGERYRSWVAGQFGVDESRIEILWNGVPVESPGTRRHENGEKPLQILFLGSLGHRKGTHDIIEALSLLNHKSPPWHMVFAGPGDIQKYQADTKARGIEQRCTFTGWLDQAETRKTLSSSDIIVLPSYHEGLPLVILEALGLGTPVIATPVGVIPEVLSDGENILFCPIGQPIELARTIDRLLSNPTLRQQLCDNGLRRYRERFSLEAFSDDLLEIWSRHGGTPSA